MMQIDGKYPYWKAMTVTALAIRFFLNCIPGKRHTGPLKTREIEGARNHWVKKVQQDSKVADGFEEQKEKYKTDQHGVLTCYERNRGRLSNLSTSRSSFHQKVDYA